MELCPDCGDTMYAVYARKPNARIQNLGRIGAWCWTCRNFDEIPQEVNQ